MIIWKKPLYPYFLYSESWPPSIAFSISFLQQNMGKSVNIPHTYFLNLYWVGTFHNEGSFVGKIQFLFARCTIPKIFGLGFCVAIELFEFCWNKTSLKKWKETLYFSISLGRCKLGSIIKNPQLDSLPAKKSSQLFNWRANAGIFSACQLLKHFPEKLPFCMASFYSNF